MSMRWKNVLWAWNKNRPNLDGLAFLSNHLMYWFILVSSPPSIHTPWHFSQKSSKIRASPMKCIFISG
jgi:hypothetical protein